MKHLTALLEYLNILLDLSLQFSFPQNNNFTCFGTINDHKRLESKLHFCCEFQVYILTGSTCSMMMSNDSLNFSSYLQILRLHKYKIKLCSVLSSSKELLSLSYNLTI